MTITAAQASAIIATKYPDLSEGFPVPEAITCTPPLPTRLRRKKPQSPLPKRMKLLDHFNQMADSSLTILYPSLYSTENSYQEEDAFLPYVSPLRAEMMSARLRVRALSTPSKKSKRASRNLFLESAKKRLFLDSAKKRLRSHKTYQNTYHNTVGLKHKILRLCGASKSPYKKSKYMSIRGKEKLELCL